MWFHYFDFDVFIPRPLNIWISLQSGNILERPDDIIQKAMETESHNKRIQPLMMLYNMLLPSPSPPLTSDLSKGNHCGRLQEHVRHVP